MHHSKVDLSSATFNAASCCMFTKTLMNHYNSVRLSLRFSRKCAKESLKRKTCPQTKISFVERLYKFPVGAFLASLSPLVDLVLQKIENNSTFMIK